MIKISITLWMMISLIIFSTLCLSQNWWDYYKEPVPDEILIGAFKEGLNVQVNVDSAVLKLGIDQHQLIDQTKYAVDNSGWKFDVTSSFLIEIEICASEEKIDERQQLKIEITHFLDEFPMHRLIDFKNGRNALLSSTVYQMIHNFCIKAKRQLQHERFQKFKPPKRYPGGL